MYSNYQPYGEILLLVDPDGRGTYSCEGENGDVQYQWFDSEKLYYADENGNTWKLHSPGPMLSQKNNTTEVITITNHYLQESQTERKLLCSDTIKSIFK
jgi:hypothetical protein